MDPDLHRYAVKAIGHRFGDDPFWSVAVATAVYIQNCHATDEIDRIVSEHAESRAGVFPADLYRGKGWDPGRALWFLGDRAEYGRAWICPGGEEWMTIERHLDRDWWRKSGYDLRGRRGCVRTITLNQDEDERQTAKVAAVADSFTRVADRLIRHACETEMPDSLRDADSRPRQP